MSRCKGDPIRLRRARRLAVVSIQGNGLIGCRPDVIRPKQPRDREPQLPLCDVNGRTNAASTTHSNKKASAKEKVGKSNKRNFRHYLPRAKRPMVPVGWVNKLARFSTRQWVSQEALRFERKSVVEKAANLSALIKIKRRYSK